MLAVPMCNPWSFAYAANRDYLTPEDINKAIDASHEYGDDEDRLNISLVVLRAIADNKCENYKLCAFVIVRALENE